MSKIKVSSFKTYSITAGEYIISKFMAPDEIISKVNGVPIDNTTIEVDESELNGNYMYLPKLETP